MDICACRSDIERCSAKTVQQLAHALGLTMEEVMALSMQYDSATGLPKNMAYFECDFPPFLSASIEAMKKALDKLDCGEEYSEWNCDFATCNLALTLWR